MYAKPEIQFEEQNELVSDNAFWIPIIMAAISAASTTSFLVWSNSARDAARSDCIANGATNVDVESKYLGAAWEVTCEFD